MGVFFKPITIERIFVVSVVSRTLLASETSRGHLFVTSGSTDKAKEEPLVYASDDYPMSFFAYSVLFN